MQADLFAETYPDAPGFRRVDTSVAAAEAVRPKAGFVRLLVLEALKTRPMTSIEIAGYIGLPYESTQPRTSELAAKGLIVDSGLRGKSRDPSKTAVVWRLATEDDADRSDKTA